jgi:hypothetical protein
MTSPSRTGRRVMRPPPQQTHQTPIATSHGHARGVVRGPLHLPMARRCHTMPVSVAPLIACPPSRLPMAQGPLPMLRCCDAATLACERWTSRGTHPHPHPISLPCRFLSYRFCGVQPSQSQSLPLYTHTHTHTHTTPAPAPTPVRFFSFRPRGCRCPFQPTHLHQSSLSNAARGTPQSP